MLVGWGGNNGATLTGGILANKHGLTWMTRQGLQTPNYWGSLTQAATCRVGNYNGEEVHTPFKALLPMAEPNDLVLGGWDISNLNLADAMERAQVCFWDLLCITSATADACIQLSTHDGCMPATGRS